MFSCEYCKNFKNTYFKKHLQTATTTTVNHCSRMFPKVAARYDKNGGLQIRLKFCKSDLFYVLQMKKRLFSIMSERNSVFLPIKFFSTGLSYLSAQSNLNFT